MRWLSLGHAEETWIHVYGSYVTLKSWSPGRTTLAMVVRLAQLFDVKAGWSYEYRVIRDEIDWRHTCGQRHDQTAERHECIQGFVVSEGGRPPGHLSRSLSVPP
jgi:hypothetical protein